MRHVKTFLVMGLIFFLTAITPIWAATTIKFYYPVHLTGPLVKEIEAIVKDFEQENPDIRVEPVWGGNYWQNMQKTMAALQAGNPPDVAVHLAIDVVILTDLDAVIPLDEFVAAEGGENFLSDFFPGFMNDLKAGGKVYAIPFQRSTPILYYNKDLFKQAGLDPAKPPTNWQELVEIATKLTVRDASGTTTQWGVIIPDDAWLLMSFMLQNGGRTHSDDFKEVYLDDEASIEALQFWVDMAVQHKVMPLHRSFPESVQDFVAGKGAMLIHSTGNLRFVRDSANFEWDVAFLPENKERAVAIGGAGLFIFKGIPRENQEAAWKFIKFATSPEIQARWSKGSGYIATRISSFDTPFMQEYTKEVPQALVARDQLPYARPEMSTYDNQKVREIFRSYFEETLDGKYTAAEGMQRASAEMRQVLEPYQSR
ncbi:probable glycerol-3-phosphate ABC transporter substrate binding protein [Candidatus Vecturithrix granuli]|uniref:Probable glycerol-3-phosphate ABC transporter substrate binding protein n=1 Tax=Vecturithrix granuli TaxID=1499967 RepID=A0A0S6W9B6_VECG1|nr:probable glycerol-3-phosphate ABC transporter substrate binding protein [Candidatus Vecturithrix granuli]